MGQDIQNELPGSGRNGLDFQVGRKKGTDALEFGVDNAQQRLFPYT